MRKPLILLDCDGVVNANVMRNPAEAAVFNTGHDRVAIPHEAIAALRVLFELAEEVLWCTARRNEANVWITPYLAQTRVLEEGEFPGWITDGRSFGEAGWTTDWKLDAVEADVRVKGARHKITGRPVWWIEDFGWSIPKGRSVIKYTDVVALGIKPIDTAEIGHLTLRQMLCSGIMDDYRLEGVTGSIAKSLGVRP